MFYVAVFLGVVAVCSAKPQYVEMFKMMPAVRSQEEPMTDVRMFNDNSARTSYFPYHETWEQFKTQHGQWDIVLYIYIFFF